MHLLELHVHVVQLGVLRPYLVLFLAHAGTPFLQPRLPLATRLECTQKRFRVCTSICVDIAVRDCKSGSVGETRLVLRVGLVRMGMRVGGSGSVQWLRSVDVMKTATMLNPVLLLLLRLLLLEIGMVITIRCCRLPFCIAVYHLGPGSLTIATAAAATAAATDIASARRCVNVA